MPENDYITRDECKEAGKGFMEKLEELRNDVMDKLTVLEVALIGDYDKPGVLTKFHLLKKDVDALKEKSKKVDNRKLEMVNWAYKAFITLLISFVAYKIGLK